MNVVFIVLDTTRKDRLSVYNPEIDFTGTIDRIVEDGRVFTQAVSQAPWTLPSHASMFTGSYPWEHGATQTSLHLDTDTPLLAERFHDSGYRTACYTANTWISPYTGMTHGFDDIDNFFPFLPSDLIPGTVETVWRYLNDRISLKDNTIVQGIMGLGDRLHHLFSSSGDSRTEEIMRKSITFIEDCQEDDAPFFLFINLLDPHLPYRPPEDYLERHAPGIDPDDHCQRSHLHNSGQVDADFEALGKLYDAEVDYMDDQLARLYNMLADRDLLDETVIVLVGDHGENLGEDGMFGHEFSVSEPLINVPLIIHAPAMDPGTDSRQIELRELYHLIPALAGISDGYDHGTDQALGGYQHPMLDLANIPDDARDRLAARLSFVREPGRKIVRRAAGTTDDTQIDLETGDEQPIDQELQQRLDEIDAVDRDEEEQMLEETDEKVRKRLEDLGYI